MKRLHLREPAQEFRREKAEWQTIVMQKRKEVPLIVSNLFCWSQTINFSASTLEEAIVKESDC